MSEEKTSIAVQERTKILRDLRQNLHQSSHWQGKVLDILDGMNHDNILLRKGYAQLKGEIEGLKNTEGNT